MHMCVPSEFLVSCVHRICNPCQCFTFKKHENRHFHSVDNNSCQEEFTRLWTHQHDHIQKALYPGVSRWIQSLSREHRGRSGNTPRTGHQYR